METQTWKSLLSSCLALHSCRHLVNIMLTQCIMVQAMVSAIGGEWVERQHPLGSGKWILSKVAACHKCGLQGIDTGLNAA